MKIKLSHHPIKSIVVATILVAGVGLFAWNFTKDKSNAADIRNFDPGNIMSDAVMSNKSTMSVQDIQNFLNSKNYCDDSNTYKASWYPHLQYNIKDGKFVCMARESFNGKSAAQIIWEVGQRHNINPQVLIVLLEKEQGLVSDTWPNHVQYRTATGYGCPDTAPCDSQYYGLENQLNKAAELFRTVLNGGWSNYPVGQRYVQYHPNAACGGSIINIQNRATSALYRYTPYQPNQSALNAGYGTGDSCGAYGNRNFWRLFTDWFGSTTVVGADSITKKYGDMGGSTSWLGDVKSDIRATMNDRGLYQIFDNGKIYWSPGSGAWTIRDGAVGNRFVSAGYEYGYLGYPLSDENAIRKNGVQIGIWQQFQGGQMYWTAETGAWDVRYGSMFNRYRQLGLEGGYLGFPKSAETRIKSGVYQQFSGGRLYWSSENPNEAIDMNENIVAAYEAAGHDSGYLGQPTINMQCGIKDVGCWQMFKGGKIYWSPNSGAYDVRFGAMNSKYSELKYENGALGYPTSREIPTGETCGVHKDVRQEFQKGTLIWSACSTPSVRVVTK